MPDTPARLTRQQAAEYLTAAGFPITPRYFAKLSMPSGGIGPKIDCYFGGRALYLPADLLAWAEMRCRPGEKAA